MNSEDDVRRRQDPRPMSVGRKIIDVNKLSERLASSGEKSPTTGNRHSHSAHVAGSFEMRSATLIATIRQGHRLAMCLCTCECEWVAQRVWHTCGTSKTCRNRHSWQGNLITSTELSPIFRYTYPTIPTLIDLIKA